MSARTDYPLGRITIPVVVYTMDPAQWRDMCDELDRLRAEVKPLDAEQRFHSIRLTSGEPIYGEYGWMECDGPDDWTVAVESDHDQPTEYEIVEMVVRPVAKRTFGEDVSGEDDA